MNEKEEYTVQDGDTIQRVAIKFHTTPTDIAKENRLSAFQPIIFTGQKLIIPKNTIKDNIKGVREPLKSVSENKSKVVLRTSHKSHPGTATRISAPIFSTNQSYSTNDMNSDGINERQFVKIKSIRIVGDELIHCPGTLLITPKFLVFDPERTTVLPDNNQEVIQTADPVYNVGLYILLDSIFALNTHSKLEDIVDSKKQKVEEKESNLKENEGCIELNQGTKINTESTEKSLAENGNDIDESPLTNNVDMDMDKLAEKENSINNESKSSKIDESESSKIDESESSKIDESKSSKIDESESNKIDVLESRKIDESETSKISTDQNESLLYLVVKAVPLSDSFTGSDLPVIINRTKIITSQDSASYFIFAVAADKIEEAYSFLILSGIGSSISSSNQNEDNTSPDSGSITTTTKQPFQTDNVTVAPGSCSAVADALREIEETKYQPQLYNGESIILSNSMLEDICRNLPSNLSDCNLHLVYQTGRHGYSLGTIYRKVSALSSDFATLLLIRDRTKTVFGAFMSNSLRISTHYYGNGETFVFHWLSGSSDFRKYEWTRENSFFMKGDSHCFAIGARSGHSAIWFEDTLKYGRSEATDTFDNPKLSGAVLETHKQHTNNTTNPSSSDSNVPDQSKSSNKSNKLEYNFVIDALEVWRCSVA